jgi:hypothetical protein
MLTRKLAGSAALLTGVAVVGLTIAGCNPSASSSSGPSGSLSTGATASSTTSIVPPPSSPSGSPKNPVTSSQPQGANPPVGTVPGGAPSGGTLVPLPPYTNVPASQIKIIGLPAQQPSAVQTAEGGRILIFHEEQAGCEQVSAQVAAQTASQVTVNVTQNTSAGAGRMCPMIVRVVPVTAALAAPLGTRTVVFQQTLKH